MRVMKIVGAAALLALAGAMVPGSIAAQAKKPTVMAHSAEGRADCLSCHATATDSTKAVPADHASRPNESCQLCHAKDATVQTKDAPGSGVLSTSHWCGIPAPQCASPPLVFSSGRRTAWRTRSRPRC
ncbi:MAG: hypothetical protein H6R40_1511 [Gemmatimonadetes bacterium]|nr:hypothetical protein [Gemmatimonadota bacterium]